RGGTRGRRTLACAGAGQAAPQAAGGNRGRAGELTRGMAEHFDTLEIRDPDSRERDLLAALRDQVAHARVHAPAYATLLADVDARDITSRAALERLPVLRKSRLLELQKADRPFGGFAATQWGGASLVFASPGPIYEPEGRAPDYWRTARALFAAGFR